MIKELTKVLEDCGRMSPRLVGCMAMQDTANTFIRKTLHYSKVNVGYWIYVTFKSPFSQQSTSMHGRQYSGRRCWLISRNGGYMGLQLCLETERQR
uniref:Uncharacterized protein n=1 Tax=Romanomermis culicivorax TaxID=13658 RepID=A0A915HR87_ROMCU